MKNLFVRFVREDEGQDLIEYAFLAAFIAIVSVAVITSIGTGVNLVFSNVDAQVTAAS